MVKQLNLSGHKFGRLTVVEFTHRDKYCRWATSVQQNNNRRIFK